MGLWQPARTPTGFLSWVTLKDEAGGSVPAWLRRLSPEDVMALSQWPEPTYFDWLGLVNGRASGRRTRAGVNYDKSIRLFVIETISSGKVPRTIIGAMAICERPKDRPDALELAYLERSPDSLLVGFGTAALALALLRSQELKQGFFLDALVKSGSHLFYARQGMIEVAGTPWPTVTVRMQFPDDSKASRFLDQVRRNHLIP